MQKGCKKCDVKFEVTDRDQEYYAKIEVPHPTLCPDCRTQRRMSFRNERNLYKGKCGLCGDTMISAYKPGHKFPVYCNDCFGKGGERGKRSGGDRVVPNADHNHKQFEMLNNKLDTILAMLKTNSPIEKTTKVSKKTVEKKPVVKKKKVTEKKPAAKKTVP